MTNERLAIVGVGVTDLGVLPDKSGTMLAVEAMRSAIKDAGLRRSDINGVLCQPGHGFGPTGRAVRRLALPVDFYIDLQSGGGTAITSVVLAGGALAYGKADYVISVYATKARTSKVLVGRSEEEEGNESVWGMFSPGARNAMRAQNYLARHKLPDDAFWPVVSNQRRHANMRPDAITHDKPLTKEDYVAAPWVTEPFRRLDFCQMNDGAAAFVITTESRARDLPKKPVLVLGAGLAHAAKYGAMGGTDYESDLNAFISIARQNAFQQAGVEPRDIDVAEFYDPFANYPIMQVESYGYCRPGEGSEYFAAGEGTLGGRLPVNTHGGHLSWGYLQGYGPLIEGVRQLREEAGATQVEDARLALITGSGDGAAGSPAFGNLILGVD